MSLKPKIILNEEIATQIPSLQVRKDELTLARNEVAARLNSIELVIKETAALEERTREQVAESVNMFLEEWNKIKECYPEVRLGILQKALEFIAPDEKKKK